MSMLLANAWKPKVSFRQFVAHQKTVQIRTMSSDRKRGGQENNVNDSKGN